MSKLTLHVSIPEPCHEDWNKMSKTECGAFCKACSKEVIDFSRKSEREIVELLSGKQGKVCGRIPTNMLDRQLVKYEPGPSRFDWKKWMIAASVLIGARETKAAGDTNTKPLDMVTAKKDTSSVILEVCGTGINKSPGETITMGKMRLPEKCTPADTIPVADSAIHITGKVTDENGEGMWSAQILLTGSGISTLSDSTGYYHLTIPANQLHADSAKLILSCRYIGYQSTEQPIQGKREEQVNFAMKEYELLGLMTVGGLSFRRTPAQKIKSFFRRIAYKFRKHKD